MVRTFHGEELPRVRLFRIEELDGVGITVGLRRPAELEIVRRNELGRDRERRLLLLWLLLVWFSVDTHDHDGHHHHHYHHRGERAS